METIGIVVAAVVLVGVVAYLGGTLVLHIQTEKRRSRITRIFGNFGLSFVLATLFLVTWVAQAIVEWPVYASEQRLHGASPSAGGYFVEFAQSTLENWQSEFLQLFSFVLLAAMFIHRGSAESRDSDDRMEASLQRIEKRLEEIGSA